jgi:hypothetical protein
MTAVSYPLMTSLSVTKTNCKEKSTLKCWRCLYLVSNVACPTVMQNDHKHNEEYCVLTCDVVYSGRNLQAFRRRPLSPSSGNWRHQVPQKSWQISTRLHMTGHSRTEVSCHRRQKLNGDNRYLQRMCKI